MQTNYSTDDVPDVAGAKVVILQVKWYQEITDGMVRACMDVLAKANCPQPEVHKVSGSLELPLAAQTVIRKAKEPYDAIICFGAILKGETLHFEMIVEGCMQGLTRVMLDEGVPIIVEVLPVLTLDQLRERCMDNAMNKGIEAALAAAETIAWRRRIALR